MIDSASCRVLCVSRLPVFPAIFSTIDGLNTGSHGVQAETTQKYDHSDHNTFKFPPALSDVTSQRSIGTRVCLIR
jgi:hypothetical protein